MNLSAKAIIFTASLIFVLPLMADEGWEWQYPKIPYGGDFKGVWAASDKEIFIIGDVPVAGTAGKIVHYNGDNGSLKEIGTEMLRAVWGASGSDVFAVGYFAISHYDGSGWQEMTRGGTYFTNLKLRGVWGSSGSDVFAVGSKSILHYDGNNWEVMTSNDYMSLEDVWGSSSNDVFAVGHYSVLHYDGGNWVEMTDSSGILLGVWGSSISDDVFAVGYNSIMHYDGSNWEILDTPVTLRDVWGTSASDVFVVGDESTILHYDGSSLTEMTSSSDGDTLYAVYGTSGSDVYAVGEDSTVLHYDGNTWSVISGRYDSLLDVWGSSGSDVFAVGDDGTILHYDGSNWSRMSSGTSQALTSVWGSSGTDVFAVGGADRYPYDSGEILHYDGSNWSEMTSPTARLSEIWGRSGSDVFAAGYDRTFIHYDGNNWQATASSPDGNVRGIWGASGNNLIAAGSAFNGYSNDGIVWRYNGGNWTRLLTLEGCRGTGCWASCWGSDLWADSDNDIFFLGGSSAKIEGGMLYYGKIYHYDGDTWTLEAWTYGHLSAIWGSSWGDVFAVGSYGSYPGGFPYGKIFHYDGSTWTEETTPSLLYGVWGSSRKEVFAVGSYGTILHYTTDAPSTPTPVACKTPIPTPTVALTPTPPCSIRLHSPNGGETWEMGSIEAVSWNDCNLGGYASIYLYRGTARVGTIASWTPNDGYYSRYIPVYPRSAGCTYRVLVQHQSGEWDTSDDYFCISAGQPTPAPTPTPACIFWVTSPNGGETWTMGQGATITWEDCNLGGRVYINAYRAGVLVRSFRAPNTGTFTIPQLPVIPAAAGCNFRIEVWYSYAVNDRSDGDFCILMP